MCRGCPCQLRERGHAALSHLGHSAAHYRQGIASLSVTEVTDYPTYPTEVDDGAFRVYALIPSRDLIWCWMMLTGCSPS